MPKKKLYFFPHSTRGRPSNPYSARMMSSLADHFDVINRSSPTQLGIFDLYRNLFATDIVLANWIENTPDRKFGTIQSFLVLLFLWIKGLAGTKLVWVLHNKISHNQANRRLKTFLVRALLHRADLILTHSREGIDFAASIVPDAPRKVHFHHHPVTDFTAQSGKRRAKDIDILIWGTMHPYKGVHEFLQDLDDRNALDRFSILVCGKFPDTAHYNECVKHRGSNITIRNDFISDTELAEVHERARVVLFTYKTESVLSSGALMDSLDSDAAIIGPDAGAFKDLADEGLVQTYENRGAILETIETVLKQGDSPEAIVSKRKAFFEKHGWAAVTGAIAAQIARTCGKPQNAARLVPPASPRVTRSKTP